MVEPETRIETREPSETVVFSVFQFSVFRFSWWVLQLKEETQIRNEKKKNIEQNDEIVDSSHMLDTCIDVCG